MADWEDDSDEGWATGYEETVWQQLQQQHAELRLHRNESISTSGLQRSNRTQRAFNTRAASDEKLRRIKVSPHQQRYYSHTNTGYVHRHENDSSLVSDADLPTPKNRSFCAHSTIPVDYVKLNRYQLKGHNNRKFIYPQKTYTGMFSKKHQSSIDHTNSSHKNGKYLLFLSVN